MSESLDSMCQDNPSARTIQKPSVNSRPGTVSQEKERHRAARSDCAVQRPHSQALQWQKLPPLAHLHGASSVNKLLRAIQAQSLDIRLTAVAGSRRHQLFVQVGGSLPATTSRERKHTSLLKLKAIATCHGGEPMRLSLDAYPPNLAAAADQVGWQPAIGCVLDDHSASLSSPCPP